MNHSNPYGIQKAPRLTPEQRAERKKQIPRCDCGQPGVIRRNREGVCARCNHLESVTFLKAGTEGWSGVLQARSRPAHLRRAEFPEHWIGGTAV